MSLLPLAALVALAFAVETAAGFGSTVVVLTVGALAFPLDALMAVVVPVNLAVSAAVLARDWRFADLRFLAAQVLPAMLAGTALGLGLAGVSSGRSLKVAYALFVVALAAVELSRRGEGPRLSRRASAGWLAAGGLAHGAFAASGPLVVWAVGRALPEKRAFRATLAALWLVLNGAWLAGAALHGGVSSHALGVAVELLPAAAVGMLAGNSLHHRLEASQFRTIVLFLMLAGGLILLGSVALGR